MRELKEIDFRYPTDKVEQQKIAQVLSTADAEIANLQAQLDKLKLEKKALMQQLLTGKRRVRLDDEEEDVAPIRRVG
jgi:type I restriction enzyme S subunit